MADLNNPAKVIARNKKTNRGSGNAKYPADEFPWDFYMVLTVRKYVRSSPESPGSFPVTTLIRLPIPDNLRDTIGLNYQQEEFGLIAEILKGQPVAAQNLEKALGSYGDMDQMAKYFKESVGNVYWKKAFTDIASYKLVRALQDSAAGGYISQAMGKIPNPNPSVVFKGVNLRDHDFTWRFAPKSQADSESLKEVLKKIRYYSLPKEEPNFLAYPHVFEPKIFSGVGIDLVFKKAHIEGLSIDYTPNEGSAFFYDKKPVGVNLNLRLKEIDYLTDKDYA